MKKKNGLCTFVYRMANFSTIFLSRSDTTSLARVETENKGRGRKQQLDGAVHTTRAIEKYREAYGNKSLMLSWKDFALGRMRFFTFR